MRKGLGCVVIKPCTGHLGQGITIGPSTPQAVDEAVARALQFDDRVVAQPLVAGDSYRLLVIDGRFAAAARLVPPSVTGDGRQSVEQLVAELNSDAKRGVGDKSKLSMVAIDGETERILEKLKKSRNRYINEAIDHYNRLHRQKILEKKLLNESEIVKDDSLSVLKDFEEMDYGDEKNRDHDHDRCVHFLFLRRQGHFVFQLTLCVDQKVGGRGSVEKPVSKDCRGDEQRAVNQEPIIKFKLDHGDHDELTFQRIVKLPQCEKRTEHDYGDE